MCPIDEITVSSTPVHTPAGCMYFCEIDQIITHGNWISSRIMISFDESIDKDVDFSVGHHKPNKLHRTEDFHYFDYEMFIIPPGTKNYECDFIYKEFKDYFEASYSPLSIVRLRCDTPFKVTYSLARVDHRGECDNHETLGLATFHTRLGRVDMLKDFTSENCLRVLKVEVYVCARNKDTSTLSYLGEILGYQIDGVQLSVQTIRNRFNSNIRDITLQPDDEDFFMRVTCIGKFCRRGDKRLFNRIIDKAFDQMRLDRACKKAKSARSVIM